MFLLTDKYKINRINVRSYFTFSGGWGGVVGEVRDKAISPSNQVKVEVELGKKGLEHTK